MDQSPRIIPLVSGLCVIVAALGPVRVVNAQPFPTKPIRMVTSQPGNGFDIASRIIAERLTGTLGQPVIVDNRGGAGGVIAGEIVARAQPDGHTLLSYGNTIWQIGFMRKNVPYDPQKDFAPITIVVVAPNVLVVHPSLGANSVKELIALARAKPGQLNYGGGNTGSTAHLAAELFKSMAGVNLVHVPYKSTAQSVAALAAGEVQVMFPNGAAASPYIKSGKVKVLAVTTSVPFPLLPGVPTVASSGLPGFESAAIHAIFAPARTPAAIVSRLNQEIVKVLNTPEITERFLAMGTMVVGSSPEQLAATLRKEMETSGKLIRALGIRVD
ncbi:MAG: Bug family tripartite tricarboxylate transporter substrate binding protein [Burkholderiales bacterium]